MLSQLHISNYALIEHLQLRPDARLNIITGETGAGKSIMLGALGLLMGNRADSKALLKEESKCIIEGEFELGNESLKDIFEENDLDFEPVCILRREIAPNGKSRAFVNDTPVTLEVLKNIAEHLIDVHSQHDTLLLGKSDYQLNLIDSLAGNQSLLAEYKTKFKELTKKQGELQKLQAQNAENKKQFDFDSFLLEELVNAKLEPGEQELISAELSILENAEELGQKLQQVGLLLNHPEQSLLNALQDGIQLLNGIAKFGEVYKNLKDRLTSVKLELADLAEEVDRQSEKVELDPERIQLLQDRLDLLFRLHQKHGTNSVEELLLIRNELSAKVEQVLNSDEAVNALHTAIAKQQKEIDKIAEVLSEKRKAVFEPLASKVKLLLADLGMPNATFKVEIKEKAAANDGKDVIEFLFSANKGFEPQILRKVASGGEMSRLMLALKYVLAEKIALPTIIFDEIDTGISGEVAMKMGQLLLEMSKNIQIISISHLHQIAGKATSHFFVYKQDEGARTMSALKKLEGDERILEIAKMIGGLNPSETAIKNAIELMA